MGKVELTEEQLASYKATIRDRGVMYLRKHLRLKGYFNTETGFAIPLFDYNAHFQREFMKLYMKEMRKLGFKNREIFNMSGQLLKIPYRYLQGRIDGSRVMHAWEISKFLDVMGMNIVVTRTRPLYRYYSEGIDDEFLVIESDIPSFKIIINKSNIYDFDVDFSKDRYIKTFVSRRRRNDKRETYYRFVRSAMEWYFMKRVGKKKFPKGFSIAKFRDLFYAKFELNYTNHDANVIKVRMGIDEEIDKKNYEFYADDNYRISRQGVYDKEREMSKEFDDDNYVIDNSDLDDYISDEEYMIETGIYGNEEEEEESDEELGIDEGED